MNKLTEQNLLKKSRFLKYSLLASISVGAIIAIPFEGMASSNQKALFRDAPEKKLSLRLSQSNGNRDTTNTPQQIGTVIVPEPERNTYTSSEIREMEISKQSKAFNPSNPLKNIPIEDHYKKVSRSKSVVGKARGVRPPTRSKTFVGTEKVEQNQNNYTSKPTEQTPQKPEIIITASSPTVSPASNGFVTAPNTPNTTLTSPEHYTTASGTPSTPATPYQLTPDSKPNDNLGAETPPNTNPKVVRKLLFSNEPQHTVQPSTQAKPSVPPKPLLSSAEVAKKMVDNTLRVNEKLGSKLADVESTIKNTQGKKNKKPLQQLQKQIVSSQKKTKALKLEAEEIGIKIKALDEENKSLTSWNKKIGEVKNKRELDKDSVKLKENNKKIDELQQKLTNKNNEANRLSEEIDISVNKVVLIKPQAKAPVTEMSPAGSFLNQQQQLEVLTRQQKVNAARQAVVDKKRAEANEVKRNSAESKELISEREGVQLERNQQHIAVEKTKKQQQAEGKQRTEREKKRKEKNHQKEKARDIVRIREDIAKKMQQISNTNTTSNRSQELELKVGAIEDEKQRREAQNQLSKIKKQEKDIKATADEAQKILNDAKKEASRTKLKKLQEQTDNHVAIVTNDKIEENIKKPEGLALALSTTSSAVTISNQSLTAKPTMQLSDKFQRTLPEDEDEYLEPIKVQHQLYTVMLSNQEVADPKSMDSSFKSLEGQNLSSAYDFVQLSASWDAAYNQRMNTKAENVPQETLTEESTYSVSSKKKQGNIIKRAVSKVGSILQTNDAENRKRKRVEETYHAESSKRKRDGETSKQRTVDKEGGFGQGSGNGHHKELILSVDSKLIEKAAQLISDLEQKRKEIQKTTISLDQKSRNRALQEINNNQQAVIKISQELQQVLINDQKNIEKYSTKIERKLGDIERRKEEVLKEIGADTQVRRGVLFDLNALEFLGYQNNLTQTLDTVVRADSREHPVLLNNLLKGLEKRKQEAKMVLDQAIIHKINNPDDNEVKEPIALVNKLLEKYDADIELVKEALEDNKKNNRKNNNVRKPLEHLDLALEAKLAPLREYDALDEELQKVIASKKDVEVEYRALRNQKHNQNPNTDLDNDPELTELATKHIALEKEQLQLEREVQPSMEEHTSYLFNDKVYSVPNRPVFSRPQDTEMIYAVLDLPNNGNNYSVKDKPVFSRSVSASSPNIFGSNEDLSWDNTGDIGVGHRYGAEDSCPTPDQSSSKIANSNDKNSSETKLALLRIYQMAVIVKRQELEQLPRTSPGAAQIVQQIEVLREKEELVSKILSRAEKDPLAFDQAFSFEAINKELKKYDAEIPISLDPQYNSDEDIAILVSSLDEEVEKLNREMDKISASDGKSESTLPAGNEEQEDTEVTESGIPKAGDKGLLALPVSSNECALALSDGRERECLALGDGSEDEKSYDSGFEEEEEIIKQLSDSDGGNLKITEVDTAIPLKQKAKKEMQTQISENAPTLNQAKVVNAIVNNMIRNRLDTSMNMSNNMVAVGAGDEEESRIKRGLWMRGMYGTNNHGRVENMTGYRGTNKGATIGLDVEIDNNILGIAYSNVHSVFKFKNSKNNDKELIDSHVVSIYGQKELPRNFALQALVSASKNFIKDNTTYSYGDTKIRSNVKHRNHSYNAEALLNYNYLLQNKLIITPNIGLRYGKSRDGVYNETGINVQEIALTTKENNILSGIVGTKVKVPLKDVLKFNNLGLTFQGAVEHNFKEKTQRINRVVKIFDTEFKQNYAIPKQPKTSYNLGTGIIGSIKNTTISLDYNYYLNKHYRSHQGSVKLKVNL
ncbi:autotransporter domain-containing protein [Rickettsia sp. TH2014]|uniref:autotransporter domain-containing protein n=1 Tax=Rickettsia sp. TH2014 TaxID=1967503 RepID=UPI001C4951DB|nr:autotransporter domain-containing protein [Rickettsia sp. TH2014]